jgi:hypothetical protein
VGAAGDAIGRPCALGVLPHRHPRHLTIPIAQPQPAMDDDMTDDTPRWTPIHAAEPMWGLPEHGQEPEQSRMLSVHLAHRYARPCPRPFHSASDRWTPTTAALSCRRLVSLLLRSVRLSASLAWVKTKVAEHGGRDGRASVGRRSSS